MRSLPAIFVFFLWMVWLESRVVGEVESSDLGAKLKQFASYEFGQSKKILHDARMAAYVNTHEAGVRERHEALLLDFLRSDASIDARREACFWLGNVGSKKSETTLKKLREQEDFTDVARIALDGLENKGIGNPEFITPQRAFQAEVMGSKKPLFVLTAAWKDEERSRHGFELVRKGVAKEQAMQWLADHYSEFSVKRQIMVIHVLVESGSPKREIVIEALSRQGRGEVREMAVRNLGFLQRERDVAFLMGLYLGSDEESADCARRALLTLPARMLQSALTEALRGSDGPAQAKAIELAEWMRDSTLVEELVAISTEEKNPNQVAAIRVLGKVAAPEMLEDMIDRFEDVVGSPLEGSYKKAV